MADQSRQSDDALRFEPADRTNPVRDRIIRHSREKFLRFGFARVTIEELCRDLRMAKKTFYKYFRNRDDLVEAIVEDNFATLAPQIQEIFQSGESAPAIIAGYVRVFHETILPRVSEVFLEDMEIHLPEVWERISLFRRGALQAFEGILEQGVSEGSIGPHVDPRVYTRLLTAIVDTVMRGSFLRENDLTITEVEPMLIRMFTSILEPEKED